ncbi:hypothetical protein Tco_0016924 [Tanacetum coccineum]
MCKLHHHYSHIPPPEEGFCSKLPFSLLGNRRWNLPGKHGFVIRSKRVPGYDDKDIEGPAVCEWVFEVTDGTIIGTKTTYALMFGDKYHHVCGRQKNSRVSIRRLIHKNINDNKPGEGLQIYFDEHVGRYIRMVEEERRDAREKEERVGFGE